MLAFLVLAFLFAVTCIGFSCADAVSAIGPKNGPNARPISSRVMSTTFAIGKFLHHVPSAHATAQQRAEQRVGQAEDGSESITLTARRRSERTFVRFGWLVRYEFEYHFRHYTMNEPMPKRCRNDAQRSE